MDAVLSVRGLCKEYPGFRLDHVSFAMRPGTIMGFIGRNGAGKSTTMKSILNFVHPSSGEVCLFGKSFAENEQEIKERIGYVAGGADFYPMKKLKAITGVARRFYRQWDESAYRRYMEQFQLSENKTPKELSSGMRVKYALVLALSHHAELLLLDEPTSGLDPVSREDLLDVFLDLQEQGVSIFFSTHITSDLDRCADDITYIRNGCIIASGSRSELTGAYRLVSLPALPSDPSLLIGPRRSKDGYTALIRAGDAAKCGMEATAADLESVMIHLEKEER